MEHSFSRRSSVGKEVGWDDIFRNVLSKRADSDDELQEALGPSVAPTAPRHLISSGVSYVKLQPSKDLAILASTSDETIQAVKTLANALGHRWRFIGRYRTPRSSPAVRLVDRSVPPCNLESRVTTQDVDTDACSWLDGSQKVFEGLSKEPLFDPFSVTLPNACSAKFEFIDGVMHVFWDPEREVAEPPLLWSPNLIPSVREYLAALQDVMIAVQDPACKTFCYRRIKFLEGKFNFHLMFNSNEEMEETKHNKHRDFYNVRKVDTHVHHSACMHQKHLLRFIRKKYRTEGDTVVAMEGGQGITLKGLFQKELGFSASEASVDHLNVHALGTCFQRFDLFNQKYNPFGQACLRDVFLKTDNHIQGRFLAELTKEVIEDLDDRKYQHAEWRVSIYGRSYEEWERLASWVVDNKLHSRRVRWIIQVPRLYHVYRKRGEISNFGALLRNVFEPLFEAVKNPAEHRKIFLFLQTMVGFDSVDDESRVSKYTMEGGELPAPSDWTSTNNPPYSYWIFYMYANIRALNLFLEARNMRPLSFRPHCGEAGSTSHLAAAFLLADGINHGILLKGAPVLEYMFYLKQIGIAVSPLSNNALFMDITKNPLYSFFKIGLNVSLSTDDPLMFHFTDEPLLEEYSIAAHVWKLSPVDLCELARNSVLQSGFEDEFKRHWLGDTYWIPGCKGNDMRRTNVSNIRLQYRIDTWREELEYMRELLNMRMVLTANQQQQSDFMGPMPTPLQASSSSQFLQVPQGATSVGLQENRASSPAYTVDTAGSPRAKERPHRSRLSPSSYNDAPSPSLVSSNPQSALSSPELAMQSTPELPLKKRSLAEQELDELSCAAEQLTLSMKLSLPPSQSEQEKP